MYKIYVCHNRITGIINFIVTTILSIYDQHTQLKTMYEKVAFNIILLYNR